jgi:hypothetical protein
MATKAKHLSSMERQRYDWLLEQFRSAALGGDGHRIFDARLALPPAKTIEESIDLASRPFVAGSAQTACWVPLTRRRSKLVMTPCDPISFVGYEAFKFGVHPEPGHRFRWYVTEFSTGSAITTGCPTREAAIEQARVRLSKDTPKEFRRKVDSARSYAYTKAKR